MADVDALPEVKQETLVRIVHILCLRARYAGYGPAGFSRAENPVAHVRLPCCSVWVMMGTIVIACCQPRVGPVVSAVVAKLHDLWPS